MPSYAIDKKPLLLVFPSKQEAHYLRCLSITSYLNSYFTISFLHADRYAPYIYQQGYDTFSCLSSISTSALQIDDSFAFCPNDYNKVETVFLDQVQLLETLQPALILGDLVPTLSMASEYTGIPFISLRSATDTRFYAQCNLQPTYKASLHASSELNKKNECNSYRIFKALRERYGLQEKNNETDEWEGHVNWIYDLSELFPLQELPFLYENIGPLYHSFSSPHHYVLSRANPIKQTILVSMGDEVTNWQSMAFLKTDNFKKYNIITVGDEEHILQDKQILSYPLEAITSLLPKADLVICKKSSPFLYQALLEGIPVLYTSNDPEEDSNFGILTQLQLGAHLDIKNSINWKDVISYWIEKKGSDAHPNIQYTLRTSLHHQGKKIEHSLYTHFPFLSRPSAILS